MVCLKTLEQHVLSLQNQFFSLPSNLGNVVEHQFYHRWRMLMIKLHYAWTFLNINLLNDDANAKEVLNRMLQKTLAT